MIRVGCYEWKSSSVLQILVLMVAILSCSRVGANASPDSLVPVPFTLSKPGFVTLVINNVQGRRVRNLVANKKFAAGKHVVWWDGRDEGLGVQQDADGTYRTHGKLVAPGTYHVQGLVHGDIDLRYELTANSSGSPAWRTPDDKGNWAADQSPPSDVLFVQRDRPEVLIGSFVAEAGDGLIWTDLSGRKLKGVRWLGGIWTGAEYMARDEGLKAVTGFYAYTASGWHDRRTKSYGELRIMALSDDARGVRNVYVYRYKKRKEWDNRAHHRDKAQVGGLAVRNGLLVSAIRNRQLLVFVRIPRAADGAPVKKAGASWNTRLQTEHPMGELVGTTASPLFGDVRDLAFDHEGRLLALVGHRLLRYRLGKNPAKLPPPEVLIAGGLEDPQRLTQDESGRIYISDWGDSNQVKVFTARGTFLRAIGRSGPPGVGPYDPEHMNHPNGLTTTPDGHLWVAEKDFLPKRVSIWTLDGKFVKGMIGPPDYGAGGEIDPKDRSRFYYADWHAGAMELKLDWAKGTSEVASVYWRPVGHTFTIGDGKAKFFNPQTPLYMDGRQYMVNAFNTSPAGGDSIIEVWLMRRGLAVPVAAVGNAYRWDLLRTAAFRTRWPGDIDLAKVAPGKNPRYRWAHPVLFAWSDRNSDGKVQPDEVSFQRLKGTRFGSITVSPRMEMTTTVGYRLVPEGYTAAGAPLFDARKAVPLVNPPGAVKPDYGGSAEMMPMGDGRLVLTGSPIQGFKDGRLQWTYPNEWASLHHGHKAPLQQYPGQLIATTKLIGFPVTPHGSDVGPIWAYNSDRGNIYLLTSDGLFVDTLFRDSSDPRFSRWGVLPQKRGMLLNQVAVPGENFWPRIIQTADGIIYVVTGKNHSSIVRVEGLDKIRRLPTTEVKVTPEMLPRAGGNETSAMTKSRRSAGDNVLRVNLRATAPKVDGILNDWSGAQWVRIDAHARAAVAVAGDRLYAAFRVEGKDLLTNTGESPDLLFKTGGALDLMIGTDPKAKPDRRQPVRGDMRLLISRAGGRTLAMLYQPLAPGSKEPVPFSSPWRTVYFDRVDNVSGQIDLASEEEPKGAKAGSGAQPVQTFELSVPLRVLNLKPRAGLSLRGDIGILRGRDGQTVQRVYWHNKASGLVNDVPGEAMLVPRLWGEWRFVGGGAPHRSARPPEAVGARKKALAPSVLNLRPLLRSLPGLPRLKAFNWGDGHAARIDLGGNGSAEATWSWDAGNLYLAFRNVPDDTPMINHGANPARLYATGDAVLFGLRTTPDDDTPRKLSGDLWLLVSVFRGKPVAVLYRYYAPGAPGPSAAHPRVLDKVRLAIDRTHGGYSVRVAVPLAELNFEPRPGRTYRGDLGVVSAMGQNDAKPSVAQWAGAADPARFRGSRELPMEPAQWGKFELRGIH